MPVSMLLLTGLLLDRICYAATSVLGFPEEHPVFTPLTCLLYSCSSP